MNKQKLKEQIQTMRDELAKMETELADSDNVELIYDGISFNLRIGNGDIDGSTSKVHEWKEAGLIRKTKELAEIASNNMEIRNKIEAYAHQIEPSWRDGGIGKKAYKVVKAKNEYFATWDETVRNIGAVYMSKYASEQICKWLNDGRIEL